MTPKQALWAHIVARHSALKRPSSRTTLVELQRWHAAQHHQGWPNHRHEGMNTGPDNRPLGWRTGADVVDRA